MPELDKLYWGNGKNRVYAEILGVSCDLVCTKSKDVKFTLTVRVVKEGQSLFIVKMRAQIVLTFFNIYLFLLR